MFAFVKMVGLPSKTTLFWTLNVPKAHWILLRLAGRTRRADARVARCKKPRRKGGARVS